MGTEAQYRERYDGWNVQHFYSFCQRHDIEHCGVCGGTLRVIACIETHELIETILTHFAALEIEAVGE